MGKVTRWIMGLLGMNKQRNINSTIDETSSSISSSCEKREKKRWSFGKSTRRDSTGISQNPVRIDDDDAVWISSKTEREQSKHAIAVAAATAVAADAAVAAVQAAVQVVKLTNRGRVMWAALKIQTIFRGFLARKALRALKGLVKLQARVRGYLVRKRATATLHSMEVLIRAQVAIRAQRARRSFNKENRIRPRKSTESFGEVSPKIVEIDTYKTRSGSHRAFSEFCENLPCREFEWCFNNGDDYNRYSISTTAHNTPRLGSSVKINASPAKSVCESYELYPNYMANTKSFNAKMRSHSAPKQRPEGGGQRKKVSLHEIMASRNSISGGIRMQRPFEFFI